MLFRNKDYEISEEVKKHFGYHENELLAVEKLADLI